MTLSDEASMFKPVTGKVNFPKVEEGILAFWKDRDVFQKSARLRQGAPQFTLYDGPPTVNGNPGIHHVLSRVYKDVIPRYKTMKGFYVFRKAGWDTHGLPVELEIEKTLGFNNKAQIEEYGIDRFNARCRESVLSYLKRWEDLTARIGFWLDMEHPYITFDNDYVESLWWIIKTLWDRGLIYQGYRVTPHCPRCGTSLSSHEVALGYEETEDPSIYIRFRLSSHLQPCAQSAAQRLGWDFPKARWQKEVPSLLAWTTTPWTLTGNVALAVAPDADYVLVQSRSPQGMTERLILAKALLDQAVGAGNWEILAELKGRDLAGLYYERLYEPKDSFVVNGQELFRYNQVVTADFVSMEDGTGIVHIAPAFGEEDYDLGKTAGLPIVQSVDLDGLMIPNGKRWDGKFVKEADPMILEDLEQRGLLHHSQTITHTYPFCWRCDTPLLYYAKPSWYIKTTAVKSGLISGNEQINWYPEYIKHGRFGEWLENNVDWALSRERFWGTPLPIWQCQQCHRSEAMGSIGALRSQPDLEGIAEPVDLHRPFVDHITFRCSCGGRMKRVPEVLDAWFDSGAMPLAQFHYPFENKDLFERNFPADYICEAIDQTRGWFYTLHALSTLLFQRPCFENVICLGHILDASGEKMSKARGNVVDPWTIISRHGADALRWYMFTSTPAGNVKRFSADQVGEVARRFLSTLWNSYSFFVLYANIDHFDPSKAQVPQYSSELDKWIASEMHQLIQQVGEAFENYNPTDAGRRIEEFVERLSNWYVRRSRRRFWKSENDADKLCAYFTLYECLVTLCKLLAPLIPFIAEEMYQNLVRSVRPEAEESVHLCAFPTADPAKIDDRLAADTRLAMKVCSLGRAARSKAGIKVRQPLARVIVKTRSRSEAEGLERLAPQILEELNVKAMEFADEESGFVDKPGYCSSAEGDYFVALSTEVPGELLEEGLAREVVHRLQTMRRSAGFDIADHIVTYYQAEPPLAQAIEHMAAYIKEETLSRELIPQAPREGVYSEKHRLQGYNLALGVVKIGS